MPSILLVGIDDASFSEVTSALCPRLNDFRTTQALEATNLWSHPACSQSRGGLLFGSWGKRIGTIRDLNSLTGVPTAAFPTLPGVLQAAGYQTALVGKWHAGQSPSGGHISLAPIERGYQTFAAGTRHVIDDYSSWERLDSGEWGFQVQTSTDYPTEAQLLAAEAWWQAHTGNRLLHVAFNVPHGPFHIPPMWLLDGYVPGPGTRGKYLSMLRSADTAFGELLDIVGPSASVWVYSDNGTPTQVHAPGQDPRKMKGTTFRGGTHVFGAARWANVPVGPNDNLNHVLDFAAGILTVAGLQIPPEWDAKIGGRPHILSEREDQSGTKDRACRTNTYLLREIDGTAEELYHLVTDPDESVPLDLDDPTHASALAYLRAQLAAAAL